MMNKPEMIRFSVSGAPKPKGSMRAFQSRTTGRMIMINNNPKTKTWEQLVAVTAQAAARGRFIEGPAMLWVRFYLPRPKAHYSPATGRLKDSARWLLPDGGRSGDLDKLERAIGDALQKAGIVSNDSQIAAINSRKLFANDEPGAIISVIPLTMDWEAV